MSNPSLIYYKRPYLIYNFSQPELSWEVLVRSKDLFLKEKNSKRKNKPIVVIDVSKEGECDIENYSFLAGWDTFGVCIWSELHLLLSEYLPGYMILLSNDANISFKYTEWLKLHNVERVFNCIYRPETLLDRSIHHYEKTPKQQNMSFKPKHYICMNGSSNYHRFDMVELLFANNWIIKGHVSYLNRYGSMDKYALNDKPKSNFQGQTITLDFDADNIDNGSNQETLPPQYSEACFDIVTESVVCDTSLHITEKVWKPILNEKPFIILGPKFAHQHLKDHFGIRPYFDLFNYEFDLLDYPERLHNMKENNFSRLLNMNINHLNHIVNSDSMKEQMAYNKSQLLAYSERERDGDEIPIEKYTY